MSTPILGPLQNGTRLQFAMEYDLPQSVDQSYGNIVITDALPQGLSWYSTSNADHKNKVFIGRIQQVARVIFSAAGNTVMITIPNSLLIIPANQGQKLSVEIDAVISNDSLITPNTVITNNASLTFTGIDLSGSGSADFILTPHDNTATITHPESASPTSGNPVPIDIEFTASSDPSSYNYQIICNFGNNLVFDPQVPGSYNLIYYLSGNSGASKQIMPVTVTKDELLPNAYHFIFANSAEIVSKVIKLTVVPETKYNEVVTFRTFNALPPHITFSYSIQIGGAQSVEETIEIPVAQKISLRKSVVGGSTPAPQPVVLTKNVITR